MLGVVEIDLTDGRQQYMLDILGRGSVIGLQSMLSEDFQVFNCYAKSEYSTIIFRLSSEVVFKYAKTNKHLMDSIELYRRQIQENGQT